jgi:dTDP-glucose pyrophosphorylase
MKNWSEVLVKPTDCIRTVIELIDNSSLQIALVVSEKEKLLGTVTDGDIRRGILSEVPLDSSVEKIMCTSPSVAKSGDTKETIFSSMRQNELQQMPIINAQGILVGLETMEDLVINPTRPNHVVLMAGGLGKRLHPLTEDCPKPLLKVGTRPILETIITNFMEYGFNQFSICVNYQADKLKNYFADGKSLGAHIEYIEEDKRMGTVGALSLITQKLKHPLFVMNGDILTKVNFKHLLDFHFQHESIGTMCVRKYDFQVPYGVVNIGNVKIKDIEEKPTHRFFVNAGIYVLDPKALAFIPQNAYFDMPDLFKELVSHGHNTAAFPIREYWIDIGHQDDFYRANGDFENVFHP